MNINVDSPVGGQAIRSILPRSPLQLMMANALTRLTGEKGQERPIDKYVRFKNNIQLWYDECRRWGLKDEEIKVLEPYYLPVEGVPTTQEKLMLLCMEPKVANFTLAEANAARKICSKKLLNKIPELKEKFVNQCPRAELGEYVWHSAIEPQLSYAFAEPHALAYSFIAIQILVLTTYYPIIYWNCACLITNSGGEILSEEELLDEEIPIEDDDDDFEEEEEDSKKKKEKNVDYGRIATAIGNFRKSGILIYPPDINKSSFSFTPVADKNIILYGLRGIARIAGEKIIKIIKGRPYISLEDFIARNSLNKVQIINLIKSGAFDSLENKPREKIMESYLESISDKKQRLTLQNMQMLIDKELVPESESKYAKLYLFNKFLKTQKFEEYYMLNESAINYICLNFDADLIENGKFILQKKWDSLYKKGMEPMRKYLKEHEKEMLEKLNRLLYQEIADKYSQGSISAWEMDSISFYYHEHELESVKENFDNFFDLADEPEIEYTFPVNGQEVKVYKLNKIIGTVIDKNKIRNTINLLTPFGVVTVRIYKNQFAMYDKQISQRDANGVKHVIEKSWFTRGTKLMIQGIRRGEDFVPKKRKNSTYPIISKINGIDENNQLILQYERMEE